MLPSPQQGGENAVCSAKQDQPSIKVHILLLRQVKEDLRKKKKDRLQHAGRKYSFYTTGLSSDNLYRNQYIPPVLESWPFYIHAEG